MRRRIIDLEIKFYIGVIINLKPMKAILFIAVVSLSLVSCSAEQEVIAEQNLKSYKELGFSKAWDGLEYRKNIRQKLEEKK